MAKVAKPKKIKEYKCFYCKQSDLEENLQVEVTIKTKIVEDEFGLPVEKQSTTRKRYHQQCKNEHEKNKEYREMLFDYLIQKYDLLVLPKNFITQFLQYIKKHNISTELAYCTYEKIGENIDWSLKNVGFDNENKALSYGFAIFRNKVNEVYQEIKREETRKKHEEMKISSIDEFREREVAYKKKKNTTDISNFL